MDLRAGVTWLFGKRLRHTKEACNSNFFAAERWYILCSRVRYNWSKGKAGHCFCGILKETVCNNKRWNRIVFSLCE